MSQTTVIPHLTCRNAPEAYEFYQKAFGAEPQTMMKMPDGRVIHAAITIGGAPIYLHEEFLEWGGTSPEKLGGSPVQIHLQVEDCDAVFARAVEAGCTVNMPLEDAFWGDRYGMLSDPFGHKWSVATTKRTVSPEELEKAMLAMSGGGCQEAAASN